MVVVQLLVTALFAAVGGFVAVSVGGGAVDADRGGMTAAVPMMTEAQLRVGGASAASDLATTTITPVRILDTREGAAALAGSKVPWGALETRTVEAAGLGTIPADAVGVVVNVTVLNATAPDTFLTLFPTGTTMPNASTINPQPNEVAFNAASVLLGGEDGTFEIYNYSGTVDVIEDVTAYMTRTLADAVDTVETDLETVETAVDVVERLVFGVQDAAGTVWPAVVIDGGTSLLIDGALVAVNSSGVEVGYQAYYASGDCSGPAYLLENQYQDWLSGQEELLNNEFAILVDGHPNLVDFALSDLTGDDIHSAKGSNGSCDGPFTFGDGPYAVYAPSYTPLSEKPVPPLVLMTQSISDGGGN